MAKSSREQIVFRYYPIWLWLIGIMTLALTVTVAEGFLARLVFMLLGLAALGLPSILTVTVDHTHGMVHLHYWSPVRASTETYPLTEISSVNVAEDTQGDKMYRLVLILWSGQVIPLEVGYSPGKRRRERRAQRLRSALRMQL